MDLIFWIAVFLASLAVLIAASDKFTEYSIKLGTALGAPPFIIGVTIVALGTSLPELATSLTAIFAGETAIVAGNVIGSNIANILLVLGIVAIYAKKVRVEWDLVKVDLPLLAGSAILLYITALDGLFTFPEAIICLLAGIVYIRYTIQTHKETNAPPRQEKISRMVIAGTLITAALIYLGAHYTIIAVIELNKFLGIGTSVIALTAVAIGTSLPELLVSLAAARRKNYDVALGNVLGSNIFNTLFVMGIPGLFATLVFTPVVLELALPVMLGATALYVINSWDLQVTEHEGYLLVIVYALFLGKILGFI